MIVDFFKGFDRIDYHAKLDTSNYYKGLFFRNKEYVVVWYGRIYRGSNRHNAVKLIEVIFVCLDDGYKLRIKVPIESAFCLHIGAILKNGEFIQKFAFDDAITLIEESAENVVYSNHYIVSKGKQAYEFDIEKYAVSEVEDDSNTLLVIKQDNYKVIIHPVTFYMAHYGVSKEVNRIAITYIWADVETYFNLNNPDPTTSDTILIPDNCVIGDAVFLHYLKHNQETKWKVKKLNERILDNIRKNKRNSSALKVEPYHQQPIEIAFKGIEIERNVMLCTEITGMSMPQGDDIHYAFNEYERQQGTTDNNEPSVRAYYPLFHNIEKDEVVIEAQKNAGNSTTAVVRQQIKTIGDIRKLVKDENITIDQAVIGKNRTVIPLSEPIPSSYAIGDRRGTDNTVGLLRVLISSEIISHENPSFKKLLKYAQSLKDNSSQPQYRSIQIDCYSNGKFHGEVVDHINKHDEIVAVVGIYVLRLIIDTKTYYFFDCNMASGIKTSGIAIKVDDSDQFFESGVDEILFQLFTNRGRLPQKDKWAEEYGNIVRFRHTRTDSSNWVTTALGNL